MIPIGYPLKVLQGKPENIFPGTSLEGRLWASPRHQIRKSSRWSNRIFRESSGDARGGRPRDVHGASICWLGLVKFKVMVT